MTSTTPDSRRWTAVLQRWPTALAIGLAALSLDGGESDSTVEGLGEALLLVPWPYLIGAKLQRRAASSWPVLLVGITAITVLRVVDVIAPSTVLVAVALILLAWSATGEQPHEPGLLRAQALGMIGFVGLALVALAVDPDLGRYLVAAGWFLHGVWDFVHLWLDKVVVRSYAEWCGVFDILVALQLLFLA